MLGTTHNPAQYPPAGKGGPSFDHLVGSATLIDDDTLLPFREPAIAPKEVSAIPMGSGLIEPKRRPHSDRSPDILVLSSGGGRGLG